MDESITAERAARLYRSDVDFCSEYEDAFVFSRQNDISGENDGPIVVMKNSYEVLNFIEYLQKTKCEMKKLICSFELNTPERQEMLRYGIMDDSEFTREIRKATETSL